MNKNTFSLRRVIALAVVAGLLLPLLFGGWLTFRQQRESLSAALDADQQRLVTLLAMGMAGSLWSMDNASIKVLEEAAALDERVVHIKLLDVVEGSKPEFHQALRQHGRLRTVSAPVRWKDRIFGKVQVDMDTGQLEQHQQEAFRQFVLTAVAQLALSLTLILLILEVRFVEPLKRLMAESVQLARRELDQPFVWRRNDELGALGNSLESTRLSLQAAFKDIQDSEQRFRSLTCLSSDWYWERDADGRMLAISQGFADITGIDPGALLGKKRSEPAGIVFPESEHWSACQACIATHQPFYDMEWQIAHADGQTRYGTISGEPIFDADGAFRGYRGVGCDLTAARRAEAAQQSALRLRHLVEHLPAGAIYIEDGNMLLNAAAEKITGYARHEIVNAGQWFDKVFAGDAGAAYRRYAADKDTLFSAPREIELTRKDGVRCTVEFAVYSDATSEVWLLHDITERKRVAAALQQTLLEQQAIFDNTNAGIEYVKERVILRCNRGFEEMLGYAPGELSGQPTRIYYPSDAAWLAHGALAYSEQGVGRALDTECEYMRKDGSIILCSTHGKSVDPSDSSKGSIWLTQDITARRRTEATLQQLLLEQQAIFENANAGISLSRDRVLQRCNRQFEQILGYLPGELNGQSARIMFPSDASFEEFGRIAYPIINTGQSWVGEWEFARKDGSLFWSGYHGRAVDIHDPAKGAIWVAYDISERKRTAAALEQALLELRAIFDNADVGIMLVKDRIIERCNRGLEEILGYPPGGLAAQSTRTVHPSDESFEAFGRVAYRAIAAGENWIGEWELVRKNGVKCWVGTHGRAIDPQDLSKGTIWVTEDITKRKQAEAALVQAKAELERSLTEVEQTHCEVMLLSELSSFLQACQSAGEAYSAIATYAARLFPDGSGALYLMDEDRETLSEQVCWGHFSVKCARFPQSECWALRRGQTYRQDQPVTPLCCPHLHTGAGELFPYACLPLIAQGATFGLLTIGHRPDAASAAIETQHRLAVALAEQTGLALANIRLRDALRQQSIRDPLTGLYNRRHMNDTIRAELARAKRKNTALALAIIDVDHFKQFNDSYGHDAGDHVLQHVAHALEQQVRESDVVCRFGGEEFVVVLPETGHELAVERADDLLQAVRGLDLTHGNRSLGRITASLGLAVYPDHGLGAEALLEAADAALYQAKNAGRNRAILSGAHLTPPLSGAANPPTAASRLN